MDFCTPLPTNPSLVNNRFISLSELAFSIMVFILPPLRIGNLAGPINSGIIFSSSVAMVEESKAPASSASSNMSLNFLGSLVLPKNSLNKISKLSATDAPLPTCPLARANIDAVVMFLI